MSKNEAPTEIQRQSLFLRWYEEYRERRYLVSASDLEVLQRGRDLMLNLWTLTGDGKIGASDPRTRDGNFLWRLFSHVLEESRLRTGDPRGLFMRHGVGDLAPKPTYPESPASGDVFRLLDESAGEPWIFKFGRFEHLQELLERGRLRVAPASLYLDPSLAPAIQDDELSYELASQTLEADIKDLDPFKVRLSDAFGDVQPRRLKAQASTNYYVWCTTHRLDIRLFDDFNGADAVLAIRDVGVFTKKLVLGIRGHLPGWTFSPAVVNYFDPYHPTAAAGSVYRSKHFKYMYQQEIRFVFLPPRPVQQLEPIFLELGPLSSIASLVKR